MVLNGTNSPTLFESRFISFKPRVLDYAVYYKTYISGFHRFFMTNINRLCCNPKKKKIMFLLQLNNRKD